ncbi:hypothetical protein FQN49_006497 [Arthroderma sp. PD_2]|nr:hypothetical protein FQN49_006497 [Arthroderma sp. PD_2]
MDRRPEIDTSRSRYSHSPSNNISPFRSRSPSLSPSPPFNTQNRRLQLRNARFRGALLASASASAPSSRQVSPPQSQIETWRSALGGIEDEDEDKENDYDHVGSTRGAGYEGYHTTANTSTSRTRRSSILRELGNSTQRRRGHTPRVSVSSIFQTQPESPPGSASFGRPKVNLQEPEPEPEPELDWEEKMHSRRKASVSSQKSSTFTSLDRLKRPKGRNREGRRDTSQYIEHLENQLAATLQDAELADANAHAARYKALNTEYRILKQEVTEWEEKFEARMQDEEAVMAEREAQLKMRIRSLEREVETKENKIREHEWEIEKDSQNLRTLEAVSATNRSLERRVDVLTELLAQSPTRVELPPQPATTVVDGSSVSIGEGMCRTPRPKSMFTKIPLSPVRQPLFQPTSEPDASSFMDPCKRNGSEEDGRAFDLASVVDSGFDSCSGPSHSQRTSLLSNQSLYGAGVGPESGSVTSFPLSPELQLQGKLRYRNRKMRRFPSGCCTLKPLVLPTASAALSPYAPPVTSSSSPGSIQQQRLARYFSTLRYSRAGSGYGEPLYDDVMDGDDADADADAARIDALDSLEGNAVHYQSFEEAMAGHDLSMDDMDDPEGAFAAKSLSPGSDMISYEGGTVRRRRNRSRQISTLRIDTGSVKRTISARLNPPPSWIEKLHDYIPQLLANARTLTYRILSNAWHSNWRRLGSLSWWFLGLLLGTHTRNQLFRRSALRNARCHGSPKEEGIEEVSTPTSFSHQSSSNSAQLLPGCPPAMQEWLKFSVTLVLAIGLAVRDGPGTLMCPCPLPEEDTSSNIDMMAESEDYPATAKYQSIRTSLSVLSPSVLHGDVFDDTPD